MVHRIGVIALVVAVSACGGKSPTAPTTTPPPATQPPPAPPAPTLVSMTGIVQAVGGARLSGATVTILDGANAGRTTTTNSNGEFVFGDLQRGDANLSARAPNYDEVRGGFNIDGTRNPTFTLKTTVPWSRSGTGANVLDMPTYIERVRIVGTYRGRCENFVIWIGRDLVVNDILGTCSVADSANYDGTHQVTGGVVRVEESTAIAWSITEVRQ